MQRAKGKIENFTHIYKLGLLPCSLAPGSLAAAANIQNLYGGESLVSALYLLYLLPKDKLINGRFMLSDVSDNDEAWLRLA